MTFVAFQTFCVIISLVIVFSPHKSRDVICGQLTFCKWSFTNYVYKTRQVGGPKMFTFGNVHTTKGQIIL